MITETMPTPPPMQAAVPASPPPPRSAGAEFTPQLANALEPGPPQYTVRTGDNLTRIVRDQLRSAGLPAGAADVYRGVKALAKANHLANPDLIYPGQQLSVAVLRTAPALASATPATAPPAAPAPEAPEPSLPPQARVPALVPRASLPLDTPPLQEPRGFRTARSAALPAPDVSGALTPSAGGMPLQGRLMGSERVALAPALELKVQQWTPAAIAGVPPPPIVPSIAPEDLDTTGVGGPQEPAMQSIKMAAVNTLRGDAIRAWIDGVFDGPHPQPENPWRSLLDTKARLTSEFGMRADPFTGQPAFHAGVDLATPTGSSIRPYQPGVVVFSGWQSGYGKMVIVRHEDGHESVYAHNSKNLVQKGDRVTTESILGEVGSTGRASGPHLHFEIRTNGKAVNPLPYLNPKETLAHNH